MLKNDYLDAKTGVDTAENEPFKVWGSQDFRIFILLDIRICIDAESDRDGKVSPPDALVQQFGVPVSMLGDLPTEKSNEAGENELQQLERRVRSCQRMRQ